MILLHLLDSSIPPLVLTGVYAVVTSECQLGEQWRGAVGGRLQVVRLTPLPHSREGKAAGKAAVTHVVGQTERVAGKKGRWP